MIARECHVAVLSRNFLHLFKPNIAARSVVVVQVVRIIADVQNSINKAFLGNVSQQRQRLSIVQTYMKKPQKKIYKYFFF